MITFLMGRYFPLTLAIFFFLIETLPVLGLYAFYKSALKELNIKPRKREGTWKKWLSKWLLLLGTLTAMIGTALWALQLDDMSPGLTKIYYYHFPVFPIMYGTALFYLFQPDGSPCFFFKIPMRYIYLGYVLLEVLAIEFLEFEHLPFILSGIYLVLAVASLIQRYYKKGKNTPSGQPQAS